MREIFPLNIVGGTKFAINKKTSKESTYNMMVSDGSLITYPGYRKILDIKPGGSKGRGIYKSPKFQHDVVVIDDGVFTVSSDFSKNQIGQTNSFSGSVFISENNANEIVIADNSNIISIFNYVNNTFVKVDVGFRVGYITFIDGYIVAPELDQHRWRLSKLNDASSFPFDAQHVGELQSQPDVAIACETLERQLFIFGKNITEIWLDIPTSALLFPFQRQNSISIDYGCISPDTIASGFHRLVWLGSNEYSGPTILVSTGGAPERISTDGINFELDNLKNPENSFGFLFETNGHIFYQITFPADGVSYAYDFNENIFVNVTNRSLQAHIARKMSFFNDRHLFITDQDGGLYEMSGTLDTYKETVDPDDEGFTIPRMRIMPPFRLPGSKRFVTNAVSLTLEQGYSNKLLKVDLSVSKDGAQTFGTILSKELKGMGDRPNKLIYRKIGAANDITFQFKFWGNDKFVITGGEMEVYR